MPSSDHYRKLENVFLSGPINKYYAPTIDISEGSATIEIPVRHEFFHAGNALHGAVYFKALDDAAYFAVNSLVEDFFLVTVTFNIYLLQPVTGGILHAEGRAVSNTSRQFIGESVLTVDGREVARGSGIFVRSKTRLAEVEGYA